MNYDYQIYERFIGSLFDSIENNTKLVIFIGKNDEIHLIKLKEIYENIIYFIVDNKNEHIVNYRFKLYYDYLDNNKENYDYIFLCDSRDVLFQKNIFEHPVISNNYDLYIFEEETNNITIDKCKFNSLYIKKSGLNIENMIYNKNIICVGTILGNVKGILSYLKEFNNILYNIVKVENRELYGTDSGINYYIIYGNLLKNIKIYICSNSDNLVYTIAFPNYLNLINYDELLNENKQICYKKEICYCVHQYDRFDDFIKRNILINKNYNFCI
tara:strand:- start:208 stop:1020 length:813 start_codon:yes stop_codon:yes gene_type:complete